MKKSSISQCWPWSATSGQQNAFIWQTPSRIFQYRKIYHYHIYILQSYFSWLIHISFHYYIYKYLEEGGDRNSNVFSMIINNKWKPLYTLAKSESTKINKDMLPLQYQYAEFLKSRIFSVRTNVPMYPELGKCGGFPS